MDGFIFLAAAVAAWELVHLYSGDVAVSSPAATSQKAMELLRSAAFWPHALETAKAFGYSLAVAIPSGVAIGLLLGVRRLPGEVADPILVSLYSLPKITLYPLVLLVFGLGMSAKVAFGAVHGIIPVAIFSMNAVRTVNPVFFKAARIMQLSRSATALRVALPAAVPEIFSGIRVGFSLTLLGVLIGEMFASQRGLGFLIMNLIDVHDVLKMMAITLLLAVFAVAANLGLLALDHRLHHRV